LAHFPSDSISPGSAKVAVHDPSAPYGLKDALSGAFGGDQKEQQRLAKSMKSQLFEDIHFFM